MSLTRSSKRAIKARHDRAAANQTMLVTSDEAQMLLRLRQLANANVVEARVALPDFKVETVDSRAIMSVLHGSV